MKQTLDETEIEMIKIKINGLQLRIILHFIFKKFVLDRY